MTPAVIVSPFPVTLSGAKSLGPVENGAALSFARFLAALGMTGNRPGMTGDAQSLPVGASASQPVQGEA